MNCKQFILPQSIPHPPRYKLAIVRLVYNSVGQAKCQKII
jgi:hypothetical protein